MNTEAIAKALVEKYPYLVAGTKIMNMGSVVLFPAEAKVKNVRDWLDTTNFSKVSAREYRLVYRGITITAAIDSSTYGVYSVIILLP